ncbi:putative ribonuclease P/MRP protein subunit POP5 isoform X1 [Iris pallida]|uniref:Ribonuclease P/MRP protein subunit POP5 isoform X1 n=1 Tax=Iris pallida TaxID=29817 RepID=A0AAX6GTZ9_IRIPA|nr:putative ribonuclease P/MRP protein subunit POP5 isoform X1 [Iris pallida]
MVLFKNRYMVIEVLVNSKDSSGKDPIIVTEANVSGAIKESIEKNFGECGLAISLGSFQVKYVNSTTKLIIVRVSRDDHQKVWCAITMVRSIQNCPVTFNLLDLSGSIRACRTAALKCDGAKFEQYKIEAGGNVPPEKSDSVNRCFEKIKFSES